jgi:hypothetical protein
MAHGRRRILLRDVGPAGPSGRDRTRQQACDLLASAHDRRPVVPLGHEVAVFVELQRVEVIGTRKRKLTHQLLTNASGVSFLRVEAIHRRERREELTLRERCGDRRYVQEVPGGIPSDDEPCLDAQDLRFRRDPDRRAGDRDLGGFERFGTDLVPYRGEDAIEAPKMTTGRCNRAVRQPAADSSSASTSSKRPMRPATTWSASSDRRCPAVRAAAVPPTSVASGRIAWSRPAAARSCSQSGSCSTIV